MLDVESKKPKSLQQFFEMTGIKQRFLAEKIGIDEGHLCRIKNGHSIPSLKLAIKISDATGIDVRDLLPKEDDAA